MKKSIMSSTRLEAFSDAVIAIIITILVLEIKLEEIPTEENIWEIIIKLTPKFASYILSFVMLAIMWLNHHQIFHQIKRVDNTLLWLNTHLLFWMSVIPFGTDLVGEAPFLWHGSFFYALIFFMNTLAFTLLRNYAYKKGLFSDEVTTKVQKRITIKNGIALVTYLSAAFTSMISVYISFAIFMTVPIMYVIGGVQAEEVEE